MEELKLLDEVDILLEPLGRSTAPAICGAVQYIRRHRSEETMVLVLPSDHLMKNEAAFCDGIRQGVPFAVNGEIVTFGIRPDRPETGYGYIERGDANKVLSFKEKPDVDLARRYLAQGNFLWNSGIFLFQVGTFFAEMEEFCPDMVRIMADAIANGIWDGSFFRFDSMTMQDVEDISIDYALMERSRKIRVIPMDPGWRDIGSWYALWQEHEKDVNGNALQGDVLMDDVKNSLVIGGNKLVAAIGLEDVLVVESGDALLVASKDAAQDVRKVVERLHAAEREEWLNRNFSSRPWGNYIVLEKSEHCVIRKVNMHAGMQQTLQKHYHRNEHWVVVAGTARVTRGDESFLLYEDQSCIIPAGVVHMLENPGILPLEMIEVQIGDYLGDDDVVRYDESVAKEEICRHR